MRLAKVLFHASVYTDEPVARNYIENAIYVLIVNIFRLRLFATCNARLFQWTADAAWPLQLLLFARAQPRTRYFSKVRRLFGNPVLFRRFTCAHHTNSTKQEINETKKMNVIDNKISRMREFYYIWLTSCNPCTFVDLMQLFSLYIV